MSVNNSQSLLNLASLVQETDYANQDGSGIRSGKSQGMRNGIQGSVNNISAGSNFSNTPRVMQGLALPQLNYANKGSEKEEDGSSVDMNGMKNGGANVVMSGGSTMASSGNSNSNFSDSRNDGQGHGHGHVHGQNDGLGSENAKDNDGSMVVKSSGDNEAGYGNEDDDNMNMNESVNTGRSTPGFMQYPKSTMSTGSLHKMGVQVQNPVQVSVSGVPGVASVGGIDMPLVSAENSPQLTGMNLNMAGLGSHHTLTRMAGSSLVDSSLGNTTGVGSSSGVDTPSAMADNSMGSASNTAGTSNASSLLGMHMPMMLNTGSDPNSQAKSNISNLNNNTAANAGSNNSNTNTNNTNNNNNINNNNNSSNNSGNGNGNGNGSGNVNVNGNPAVNLQTTGGGSTNQTGTNSANTFAGSVASMSNMVSSASQRMMSMKSDFNDLPIQTDTSNEPNSTSNPATNHNITTAGTSTANASSVNANTQPILGTTPDSLLQNTGLRNSSSLISSSLPSVTILNEGEQITPDGELRGKSGKLLRNTKRAAQNRNAQRAFRQRREKYIKDLEFKAKDYNRLAAELESYKAENRMLKSQLSHYQQRMNL